jgi:hypothetical protein
MWSQKSFVSPHCLCLTAICNNGETHPSAEIVFLVLLEVTRSKQWIQVDVNAYSMLANWYGFNPGDR